MSSKSRKALHELANDSENSPLRTNSAKYKSKNTGEFGQNFITEKEFKKYHEALSRVDPMKTELCVEVVKFAQKFPYLFDRYHVIDKIGEGTFSTVYKAVDNLYSEYDNSKWISCTNVSEFVDTKRGHSPVTKRVVALKKIFVNSSPARIHNEIDMLHKLSGSDHVMSLITAHRHLDQVVLVMPHFENDDFRACMLSMTVSDIQHYMRSIMAALAHTHKVGIIHRDIKPSNFLFDMQTKRGVLVDFGLAEWASDYDEINENEEYINRSKSGPRPVTQLKSHARIPGYFIKDPRPSMKASRAGTRGFRAPEVLFKFKKQTTALDIWSVGVILLCILTKMFPFFNSPDDVEALAEIACIFGNEEMAKSAKRYKREWHSNLPTIPDKRIPWEKIVKKFNPVMANNLKALPSIWDFMDSMFQHCYDERITAQQALEHPFLRKIS